MTGIRIRWAALGKVTAIAVAALALLQALPELLRAPQPPPLAADVGLPRPQPVPRFERHEERGKGTTGRPLRREPVAVAAQRRGGPAGTAVIGSTPHRRPAQPRAPKPAPEPVTAAPVQTTVPPPSPAPPAAAETPAAAAPESPNDGSVEFAPH